MSLRTGRNLERLPSEGGCPHTFALHCRTRALACAAHMCQFWCVPRGPIHMYDPLRYRLQRACPLCCRHHAMRLRTRASRGMQRRRVFGARARLLGRSLGGCETPSQTNLSSHSLSTRRLILILYVYYSSSSSSASSSCLPRHSPILSTHYLVIALLPPPDEHDLTICGRPHTWQDICRALVGSAGSPEPTPMSGPDNLVRACGRPTDCNARSAQAAPREWPLLKRGVGRESGGALEPHVGGSGSTMHRWRAPRLADGRIGGDKAGDRRV